MSASDSRLEPASRNFSSAPRSRASPVQPVTHGTVHAGCARLRRQPQDEGDSSDDEMGRLRELKGGDKLDPQQRIADAIGSIKNFF